MKIALAALVLAAAACGQGDADLGDKDSKPRVVFDAPPPIKLTGRVVDNADILDAATELSLTQRLAQLEAQTRDQLVVVTVPTLGGQPINKYSLDLANRWGIGRADLDNGVLLLVAPNEHMVRIEVGLGLEGLLTDAKALEIIQGMVPEFRSGDLQKGIVSGEAEIEAVLKSDLRRPQPKPEEVKKAA